MLNIKERQTKLKALGLYNGSIDGIEGKLTKKGYLDLQKKYFTRKIDIDGVYGKNTDILLQCAYNCNGLKHFVLKEFKCQCGGKYCTGYPDVINYDLVHYADIVRDKLGVPMTITSGLRCSKHNSIVGGAILSRHKSGKAFDFTSSKTNKLLSNREMIINYWVDTFGNTRYGYCNGYANNKGVISYPSVSTMGNSVHLDVK